jgi:hypothetical protein
MKRWAIVAACLLSACSGNSPTAPPTPSTPATITLSGTVTATNGGQPLSGAVIDVAGKQVVTATLGTFSVEVPAANGYHLMISGAGLVTHTLSVTRGPLALDAITQSGGFDLAFYRQLVRNGFEAPGHLAPILRWGSASPAFDIETIDDAGTAIDPTLRAGIRDQIAIVVPQWTDGRLSATFTTGGVKVRWKSATTLGICGTSNIGLTGEHVIELYYRQPGCPTNWLEGRVITHEVGHLMGFFHTGNPADMMFGGPGSATEITARERYHAAIAYRRPIGNTDADNDP